MMRLTLVREGWMMTFRLALIAGLPSGHGMKLWDLIAVKQMAETAVPLRSTKLVGVTRPDVEC